MMRRDMPTSRVPISVEVRVRAGHALPSVDVVSPQPQREPQEEKRIGGSGKRKAAVEGGEDAQGAERGRSRSGMQCRSCGEGDDRGAHCSATGGLPRTVEE